MFKHIATLIKSKLETGNYDMYEVRDTLGHENIQTSTNYIRNAKQYMKLAPYDWFKRVLKFNKSSTNYIKEENTLKSILWPKTTLSTGDS